MYNAGQMRLQSANWLNSHTADRPSFHAKVCRMFSTRNFQVFAMPQGLLFLQAKGRGGIGGSDEEKQRAMMIGAVLGGMIGATIGAALADSAASAQSQENFELCSEEELFEIAKKRKHSFVAKHDEINSVSIDAPEWLRSAVRRQHARRNDHHPRPPARQADPGSPRPGRPQRRRRCPAASLHRAVLRQCRTRPPHRQVCPAGETLSHWAALDLAEASPTARVPFFPSAFSASSAVNRLSQEPAQPLARQKCGHEKTPRQPG